VATIETSLRGQFFLEDPYLWREDEKIEIEKKLE